MFEFIKVKDICQIFLPLTDVNFFFFKLGLPCRIQIIIVNIPFVNFFVCSHAVVIIEY